MIILMVFLGKVLSLLRFELYEFAHNSMQYASIAHVVTLIKKEIILIC